MLLLSLHQIFSLWKTRIFGGFPSTCFHGGRKPTKYSLWPLLHCGPTCAFSHLRSQLSLLIVYALLKMITQQFHQCWRLTAPHQWGNERFAMQLILAQHQGLVSTHLRSTEEQEMESCVVDLCQKEKASLHLRDDAYANHSDVATLC